MSILALAAGLVSSEKAVKAGRFGALVTSGGVLAVLGWLAAEVDDLRTWRAEEEGAAAVEESGTVLLSPADQQLLGRIEALQAMSADQQSLQARDAEVQMMVIALIEQKHGAAIDTMQQLHPTALIVGGTP